MAEREKGIDAAKGIAETGAVITVAALAVFAMIASFLQRR